MSRRPPPSTDAWNDPLMTPVTWDCVKKRLAAVASRIQVETMNGEAGDVRYYKEAKNGCYIIAIGGDKLSRGLTLEGLTVSYFLRPSHMYDTLMQMGRWFGYRPGYLDACRLFITARAAGLVPVHRVRDARTPQGFRLHVADRRHPAGVRPAGPPASRPNLRSPRRTRCGPAPRCRSASPTRWSRPSSS